jgi:hypothetical protein
MIFKLIFSLRFVKLLKFQKDMNLQTNYLAGLQQEEEKFTKYDFITLQDNIIILLPPNFQEVPKYSLQVCLLCT